MAGETNDQTQRLCSHQFHNLPSSSSSNRGVQVHSGRAANQPVLRLPISAQLGKKKTMFSSGNRGLVAALGLLSATTVVQQAAAHPGCRDSTGVSLSQSETIFCPTNVDPLYSFGICCDASMEANMIVSLDNAILAGLPANSRCAEMYQEVRGTKEESAVCLETNNML